MRQKSFVSFSNVIILAKSFVVGGQKARLGTEEWTTPERDRSTTKKLALRDRPQKNAHRIENFRKIGDGIISATKKPLRPQWRRTEYSRKCCSPSDAMGVTSSSSSSAEMDSSCESSDDSSSLESTMYPPNWGRMPKSDSRIRPNIYPTKSKLWDEKWMFLSIITYSRWKIGVRKWEIAQVSWREGGTPRKVPNFDRQIPKLQYICSWDKVFSPKGLMGRRKRVYVVLLSKYGKDASTYLEIASLEDMKKIMAQSSMKSRWGSVLSIFFAFSILDQNFVFTKIFENQLLCRVRKVLFLRIHYEGQTRPSCSRWVEDGLGKPNRVFLISPFISAFWWIRGNRGVHQKSS